MSGRLAVCLYVDLLANAVDCTGYPMAKNLRARIPDSDTLVICDVNKDVTQKFVEEVGVAASATGKSLGVEIAKNSREVADRSVSCCGFPFLHELYAGKRIDALPVCGAIIVKRRKEKKKDQIDEERANKLLGLDEKWGSNLAGFFSSRKQLSLHYPNPSTSRTSSIAY